MRFLASRPRSKRVEVTDAKARDQAFRNPMEPGGVTDKDTGEKFNWNSSLMQSHADLGAFFTPYQETHLPNISVKARSWQWLAKWRSDPTSFKEGSRTAQYAETPNPTQKWVCNLKTINHDVLLIVILRTKFELFLSNCRASHICLTYFCTYFICHDLLKRSMTLHTCIYG